MVIWEWCHTSADNAWPTSLDPDGAWAAETEAMHQTGLATGSWVAIDQTGTRVDGQNEVCHVVGNRWCTSYHTRPGGTRQDVLAVMPNLPRACVPHHQAALAMFGKGCWAFYRDLLAYQQAPTAAERARLNDAFDTLIEQETRYAAGEDTDIVCCVGAVEGGWLPCRM